MKLIFATNNDQKVTEMQAAIGNLAELVSLRKAGILVEIPEPHDSLEGNASEKSATVRKMTGMDCFSEDTGLEVEALGGEPGVKSARYAGEQRSFKDNIKMLLEKMKGLGNRKARFRTVISLRWKNSEYLFEGICEGQIANVMRGEGGFGYDPVFIPEGSPKTFGEMDLAEKNLLSHRRKAADKLADFLSSRLAEESKGTQHKAL